MTSDASIALVLCARNGERYLTEALDSVWAQSRRPDQFVLVDDGSTDSTAAIAASHPCGPTIVTTRGLGHPAARNLGITSTTRNLVAFLDADDLWQPNCLADLSAALANDPLADMVFGYAEQFASPDLTIEQRARYIVPTEAGPGYLAGAMLVRRSCLDAVGPFDESLRVGDFIAWMIAARAAHHREIVIDHLVLRRRHHPGNLGRSDSGLRSDFVRIARDAIARRRQSGDVRDSNLPA